MWGEGGGVIGFYFNRVCVKFCGKIFTDTLWVGGWVNACINWFYLWPSSLLTGEPDQSHRMAWTWKCADIYICILYTSVCVFYLFVPSIFRIRIRMFIVTVQVYKEICLTVHVISYKRSTCLLQIGAAQDTAMLVCSLPMNLRFKGWLVVYKYSISYPCHSV